MNATANAQDIESGKVRWTREDIEMLPPEPLPARSKHMKRSFCPVVS